MAAPAPRSPPMYPDLTGQRRLQLELQNLSRERGLLQNELQSLEGLQSVSTCCKEVNEFVGTNPDPLVPIIKKAQRSCPFLSWIGSKLCRAFSWICCCSGCCNQPKCCTCFSCPKNLFCCSHHCDCFQCHFSTCFQCHFPTCNCKGSCCCNLLTCFCPWSTKCCCTNQGCCILPSCSCPEYSCGCVFDCPKCCNNPKKPCCVSGCFC